MANLLQNVLIQFGKNFDRPYLKSYKKVGRQTAELWYNWSLY